MRLSAAIVCGIHVPEIALAIRGDNLNFIIDSISRRSGRAEASVVFRLAPE
jgi:hypothetical protein